AAKARQAQAESSLAQAKLRHSLATDPVSLHTLKAAVDVGTGHVHQALAHVDDTSNTVTRLQSWAAQNHDDYQHAANTAADRLDAARRTHSHGLGGWLSSHAKGLLGDVEGGIGTAVHVGEQLGGDLLRDGEQLVAADINDATDFVKGLGDFVVGLKDLGVMAVKLGPVYGLIDPSGQREEEQRLGRGLAYSATHPLDVIESMIDWKDLTNGHPARALGQLAPNIALVVFTGGGGAAADAAEAGADGVGVGALKATTGGIGPVAKGQAGVARAIGEIESEGGAVLGNGEITIDTPVGRTRIDLVQQTSTGERKFVEVKNGPTAKLNANQKRVFDYIRQFGGTPVGQRAAQAGFTPGEPIPPTPVEVRTYP
ncbi:MAG: hypothetical protein QOE37_2282, partial [Microbacteriaceae bacterium]|nr:hypothetical protein [Microbacteriaceae bacterium]